MITLETFIEKQTHKDGEHWYIPYRKEEVACFGIVFDRDVNVITLPTLGCDRDDGNIPYTKGSLENAQWIIDKYLEQLKQQEGG